MSELKERAAFEAWFRKADEEAGVPEEWLVQDERGGYADSTTHVMWTTWQAARAAPDEASRAPAPQEQPAKGDDTLGALIDLHGQVSHFCETEGEADFETGRATRAIKAAKAARALLAQSQGGQPATSREQGADHA